MKSFIYNFYRLFSIWMHKIRGFRLFTIFGLRVKICPETIFPDYRKFPLPKKSHKSEIVRYADYVQIHSVIDLASRLDGNQVIVEIGAHHGAYAVLLGKCVEKNGGKVIAVEPNPLSFELLRNNIRLNKLENVVVCDNVAITDRNCKLSITNQGGQSSIKTDSDDFSLSVDAITLSNLLQKHAVNKVSLLLVDVEGAEFNVLQGFPWLEMTVDAIFCEMHPYAWKEFGFTGSEFSRFLRDKGYRCFDMYFNEYTVLPDEGYLGPCVLIPERK